MLFTPVVGFSSGHVCLPVPNPSTALQLRCDPVGSDSQVFSPFPNLDATQLSDLGFVQICALDAVATVNLLCRECGRSVQPQICCFRRS